MSIASKIAHSWWDFTLYSHNGTPQVVWEWRQNRIVSAKINLNMFWYLTKFIWHLPIQWKYEVIESADYDKIEKL